MAGLGDDVWSIGCRTFSFSRNHLRRAAEAGRYPCFGVLDKTHHFAFLIEGVPVRFFRGDAEERNKRTLRQQESEAQQLALSLGQRDEVDGFMFRLAVATGKDGEVTRVVFLALRGEADRVECFWPVPGMADAPVAEPHPRGTRERRNDAPAMQLPFPAASPATRQRQSAQQRGRMTTSAAAESSLYVGALPRSRLSSVRRCHLHFVIRRNLIEGGAPRSLSQLEKGR
ncbi:hypothetical protein D9599_28610 [Roseomonas sp. KE2513]|nr:hypothetical protein [Roseomonas sp. KE2513]